MTKSFLILLALFGTPLWAINPTKGDWIGSGGAGVSLSPTLMMISPQLEFVYSPDVSVGLLSQLGFGATGTLFTLSGTGRLTFARKGKMYPNVEGGIGLALANELFDHSLGVHLHMGFGLDYMIDQSTAIGTMLRFNFAPPLKSMFITWPLLIGRFLL